MEKWEESRERYVALLDIMGFKDRVSREEHTEVKATLIDLLDFINKKVIPLLKRRLIGYDDTNADEIILQSATFSDSILFVTKDDSFSNLFNLIYALASVQKGAIQLNVPTKGVISFGMFTSNFEKSLFFGQPLIDAYLLQEELNYYGVILDNKVESKIWEGVKEKEIPQDHFDQFLFESKNTPFKNGAATHLNIIISQLKKSEVKGMYSTVAGSTRKYVDNTLKMLQEIYESKGIDYLKD